MPILKALKMSIHHIFLGSFGGVSFVSDGRRGYVVLEWDLTGRRL